MKVLWLSPNLNHYKARYLNILNDSEEIELAVLAGIGRKGSGQGDKYVTIETNYQLNVVNVGKAEFGFSRIVRKELKNSFSDYDWIMIPREKKNLLLILYAFWLRKKAYWGGRKVKLFTYNHPISTSGLNRVTVIDKLFTRFYHNYYDRVIFYTEKSREEMILKRFIKEDKAFWANNTIDTTEISANYSFSYPDFDHPTILFIGRLLDYKKVDVCIEYYHLLKEQLKEYGKKLNLIIIGDGPQRDLVKAEIKKDSTIEWTGAIVKVQEITPFMSRANLVFVPGASGLAINHAFCYGRPYFTLPHKAHGPEINYIINNHNGYLLNNNKADNLELIGRFLLNFQPEIYDNAFKTGQNLSIENWCTQIIEALKKSKE